jgi:hypothetical protein
MSFTINSFRQLYQLYDIIKYLLCTQLSLCIKMQLGPSNISKKIENVGQRLQREEDPRLKTN